MTRAPRGRGNDEREGLSQGDFCRRRLTGLGGNMLILDDPQKPADAQSKTSRDSLNQWFTNTLMSRLDNKETGAIIVVTQRVHMDDLSGYLMSGSADWEVLSLPAIAEVDEQVPIGDDEFHYRHAGRRCIRSTNCSRCCESSEGPRHLRFRGAVPAMPHPRRRRHDQARLASLLRQGTASARTKTKVIQSWDIAAKDGLQNDYSVCTTWLIKMTRHYLSDRSGPRPLRISELKRTAMALAERYKPTAILIEDASAGIVARARNASDGAVSRQARAGRARQGDQALRSDRRNSRPAWCTFRRMLRTCQTCLPNSLPSPTGSTTTRSTASRKRLPTNFRPTRSTTCRPLHRANGLALSLDIPLDFGAEESVHAVNA